MGKHEDKLFMRRFGVVIGVLVAITVVILILASTYEKEPDPTENPSKLALSAKRVAPAGAVRTEMPTGEELVRAEAPVQVAAAPDGETTYASACQACHMTGAAGAPIPGSDLWAERAAKGAETLYANAINGINAMPAKGGRMDLSDQEVKAAVDHMLAQ